MFSKTETSPTHIDRWRGTLLALLGSMLMALSLGSVASAQDLGATEVGGGLSESSTTTSGALIASDQLDYAPGAHVVLTGAGWQPGETVDIFVEDDGGHTWQRSVVVEADEDGGLVDEFDLPDWYVATYSVVATGSRSGVSKTSFTDSTWWVKNASTTPATTVITYKMELFPSPAKNVQASCTGSASVLNTSIFTITGPNQTQVAPVTAPAANAMSPVGKDAIRLTFVSATNGLSSRAFEKWGMANSAPGTNDGVAFAGSDASPVCITDANDGKDIRTISGFSRDAQTSQTIDFTAPANRTYGAAAFSPGATATSGLAVTYSSSTPTVCTVSSSLAQIIGVGTCTLTASQAGNGSFSAAQDVTRSFSVTARGLTSSFTAADKAYDGNRDATFSGAQLSGVINGDDVDLENGVASFGSATAGTGKTVTGSGFSLSGADAGKYSLSQPTDTADITAKGLSGTLTVADKEYDGTTAANVTDSALEGVVSGDDVDLVGGSAEFVSAAAGEDRIVNGTGYSLGGTGASNYSLGAVAGRADITPKNLTSSFTAADKVYDGGVGAAISGSDLDGAISGDDVSLVDGSAAFADAHVENGKTVTGDDFTLAGEDRSNYSLTQPPSTTADITAKSVGSSFTAGDKVYDGEVDTSFTGAALDAGDIVGDDDVSLDQSGGAASFRSAAVGTGKPVDGSGFDLDGSDAGNYSLSQPTGTADITPEVLSVNADNASMVYGGAAPTLTATLTGFVDGESRADEVDGDPACSIDPETSSEPGSYPGAITCGVEGLSADNYTFEPGSAGTLTIDRAPSSVVYDGDVIKQYSDVVNLSADVTPAEAGRVVTFAIGTQSATATTDADGVAATTLTLTQAPAATSVTTSVPANGHYLAANDSDTFNITRENARVAYTGESSVPTTSATSSTATIRLSALVRDITEFTGDAQHDPNAGDIRNARVEFFDASKPAPSPTLCSAAVGLPDPSVTTAGSSACDWKVTISGDSAQFTIGTRVVNYYTQDSSADYTAVNVYKPLAGGFITGGGHFVNGTGVTGSAAAAPGRKTNFGFNVKYNKSNTNLQGNINTIVRSLGKTYQVKGNAMTSLVANATARPATAVFEGKASIQDITNPLAPVALTDGGNALLRVTMTDKGEPGSSDMIGITVYGKTGALWYSSLWGAGKTVEQLLGGGNLVVR